LARTDQPKIEVVETLEMAQAHIEKLLQCFLGEPAATTNEREFALPLRQNFTPVGLELVRRARMQDEQPKIVDLGVECPK
jgi:hypothetical protein